MERVIVFIYIVFYEGTNVDALEKLIKYGVTVGLRYEPTEHPLLIVEDPFCFGDHRKRLAEIMFEKLGFPAIYFLKSAPCIGYPLSPLLILASQWAKLLACLSISVPVAFALFPYMMATLSCPVSIVFLVDL